MIMADRTLQDSLAASSCLIR